ncbi:MAG: hypothetical protein R2715_08265 [Ilumatobacteraceae bacterium]
MTDPSPSTASNPTTFARMVPCFTTRIPPAFVATMPPIVAESRAPRSTPNSHPVPWRWRATAAGVVPAPTVIWPASKSGWPRSSIRAVESTIEPCGGTAPATSPVLPP